MTHPEKIVYFAHGMESGPWGTKIQALSEVAKALGFTVESPDFQRLDLQARVELLVGLKPRAKDCLVLVGSSMGAMVVLEASWKVNPHGMFLMAPAVYVGPWAELDPKPVAIRQNLAIHGWEDEVVPVENAIRYCRKHQVPLECIPSDHRLNNQIPWLKQRFAQLLTNVAQPDNSDFRTPFEIEQEAKFQNQSQAKR